MASASLTSRADVTTYLADIAADLGADFYMLLGLVHDRDRSDARIIASNWVYDAIHLFGLRNVANIALSGLTAIPGHVPSPLLTANAPDLGKALDGAAMSLLSALGHAELYSLKLYVGRQRYTLLLSSDQEGDIDAERLSGRHLDICYKFSRAPHLLAAASMADPLTDRERECMFWVSEGKTTDDIAMILGVSANTANSYIANAIQKLGSSNRAMAIATAIRSGVI